LLGLRALRGGANHWHIEVRPVKKFILIEGDSDPQGDPCEAKHWHGFIHYEKETVKRITDWIQNPQS
jgi:hypothetical protein